MRNIININSKNLRLTECNQKQIEDYRMQYLKSNSEKERRFLSPIFSPPIAVLFCAMGLTTQIEAGSDKIITENFTNNSSADYLISDSGPVGNRERIAYSDDTGFGWGGYNAETTGSGARIVLRDNGNDIRIKDSSANATNANQGGTYLYTLFSANAAQGDLSPTQSIDLTGSEAAITYETTTTSPDQRIRFLLRDAKNDWYLSNDVVSVSKNTSQRYNISDFTWLKVRPQTAQAMNALDDGGDVAMSTFVDTAPDLGSVTGGGFFIQAGTRTREGILTDELRVSSIAWNGNEVTRSEPGVVNLTLEAEDYTRINDASPGVDSFSQSTRDDASGGTYMQSVGSWGKSWLEYDFVIPTDGVYEIAVRGTGVSTGTNSFRVSIDGGVDSVMQLNKDDSWGWETITDANSGLGPYPLSAGTHTLRLKKREPNAKIDQLRIAGTSAVNLPVTGLSTNRIEFGEQVLGGVSAARSVNLSNNGTAPLNISGIFTTVDFSETNDCNNVVAVNANCTINVKFAPSRTGVTTGELSIASDDINSPAQVILTGSDPQTPTQPGSWRSALYPENWKPGDRDADGNFLQDFSYAGYHKGEQEIPVNPPGRIYDVTQAPYNADNSGSRNSAPAIQRAINAAKRAGSGIVYFPAGTYRITSTSSIKIDASNIVLRGDGPGITKLYLDVENARKGSLVWFGKDVNDWADAVPGTAVKVAQNIAVESRKIKLDSWPGLFKVGDEIIIAHDITAAWVDDHNMRKYWIDQKNRVGSSRSAPRYYRTITALDSVNKEITVDIPIRYIMKTRDNLRVYKPVQKVVVEVGIEDLSLGMKQHSAYRGGRLPTNANYKNANGTGVEKAAYELYESAVIRMEGVKNGWVRNVTTYRPPDNASDLHIHSRGINLVDSRNITITETRIEKPQSRTGGGNGYLYRIDNSQENLIINSTAVAGRHNFTIQFFRSSGNVFHKYTSIDSHFPSDTHGSLSPANLVDNSSFSGTGNGYWGVSFRNRASGAGWTTTQSVFWNLESRSEYDIFKHNNPSYISRPYFSDQFATGYTIGTSAINNGLFYTCPPVKSDPLYDAVELKRCRKSDDYVEGIGQGATLSPQSLYIDQRARRTGK